MNYDDWGEVTNGEKTYKGIASVLLSGQTIGIGWTDQEYTHLDLIFNLGIDEKIGQFQRGMKQYYLYISIIDHTCMGFRTDDVKNPEYIMEKLRMNDVTGNKLSELINGIIVELNKCSSEGEK